MFESNKYFAMAPDERHYRLSLRTFYGNEKSHNPNFTQNIKNTNYLSELDGRLNENIFNKELEIMINYIKDTSRNKKIIAIGNPPYQEEDEGYGKSAKPIYNVFIEHLINSQEIDQFCLVIPARWFSGGKGLDGFRKKIIMDKKIQKINFFSNSNNIFPTVNIRGGVCFLHWNKNYNGDTILYNKTEKIRKDFSKWKIIIPYIEAYPIIDKVLKKCTTFVSEYVWARNPFGLPTNYTFSRNKKYSSSESIVNCLARKRTIYKIPISSIPKNKDKVNEYQIAFPNVMGGGKGRMDKILTHNPFFILEKGQISTETYSVAGSFKNRNEAENFLIYMRTNFTRFLLGLRKPTHHTKIDTFSWIPLMPLNKSWTDKELFEYFDITQEEQKYIINQVEKWTG